MGAHVAQAITQPLKAPRASGFRRPSGGLLLAFAGHCWHWHLCSNAANVGSFPCQDDVFRTPTIRHAHVPKNPLIPPSLIRYPNGYAHNTLPQSAPVSTIIISALDASSAAGDKPKGGRCSFKPLPLATCG